MRETDRIKDVYEKRDREGKRKLYALSNPASLFAAQQRERAILDVFSRFGIDDLSNLDVLDVGCGSGSVLRDMVRYGADPDKCSGIDLLPFRIEEAQRLSPNMHFQCNNAERLPYRDATFDLVLCFTVFSSILDPAMKRNLAKDIMRVVKPGGMLLWYDYHMNNPRNKDVRGVAKKEIRRLYEGYGIELKRITLAPPLSRLLAPWSWMLCHFLEQLTMLNTHYLGVIRKPVTSHE
jgi:ubiquinone/menaquinone biosynthesis C-methylase UbiE